MTKTSDPGKDTDAKERLESAISAMNFAEYTGNIDAAETAQDAVYDALDSFDTEEGI